MGQKPEGLKALVGQDKKTFVWLFSNSNLIPRKILSEFQHETGETLIALETGSQPIFLTEVHKADLILAPLGWIPFEKGFDRWSEESRDLVSADFLGAWIPRKEFLPLFWNLEGDNPKRLTVYGLVAANHDSPILTNLLSLFKSRPDLLKAWAMDSQAKSALKDADQWDDFPEELRPRFLRTLALPRN